MKHWLRYHHNRERPNFASVAVSRTGLWLILVLVLLLLATTAILRVFFVVFGRNPNHNHQYHPFLPFDRTLPKPKRQNDGLRLRLIWHVGPMKTGTTTLQWALREWSDVLLRDDHWAYLGPSSFMHPILSSSSSSNHSNTIQLGSLKAPDFPERFCQLLGEFQERNLNVIVSSEYFSIEYRSEHYRAVQEALAKTTTISYNVQIVIGYRPYYEWIPSRYSQAYKYTPQQRQNRRERPRPPTEGTSENDTYPWKDRRGRWKHPVLPMFPTYYEHIDGSEHIFTDHVYDFVQPHFPNITLLALAQPNINNNDTDLVETWFCDIVRAVNTCQQYKLHQRQQQQQPPGGHIANPSRLSSIRSDAIAMGAAAQGLIDIQHYTRIAVMEAVERQRMSKTTETPDGNGILRRRSNLPLICPDSTLLNHLWEQTVSKEARLFSFSSSSSSSSSSARRHHSTPGLASERATELRQGFQRLIDHQTFCHVNVTALLEDRDWRSFFAQFQVGGTG